MTLFVFFDFINQINKLLNKIRAISLYKPCSYQTKPVCQKKLAIALLKKVYFSLLAQQLLLRARQESTLPKISTCTDDFNVTNNKCL